MELFKLALNYRSILKKFLLPVSFSLLFSMIGAITGGISIGLLLPIIDDNSEKVFNELGLSFLNNLLVQLNIDGDLEKIRVFALLIIMLTIFETILNILSNFISINISTNFTVLIQNKLLNKYFEIDQHNRNEITYGYIFSLISESSRQVGSLFIQILNGAKNVFIVVVYSYVLLKVSLLMTLNAFLLLGVLSIIVKAFFGKRLKRQSQKTIMSLESLNTLLIETLKNSKFINATGKSFDFLKRVDNKLYIYKENIEKRNKINALSGPIFNTINAVSIALLLIVGTYVIDQPSEDWLPLMVPFIIIIFRLISPINSLNSIRIRIEGIIPDIHRIRNFVISSSSRENKFETLEFKNLNSEIRFENLSFKYKDDRKFNIDNINLTFPKNKFVALIGPSGGGKTTVIDLLLKVYDYQKGEIYVDDCKLSNIKSESWQNKIAYVSQDPVVFNTTIKNNLVWFNENASEEMLIEATKKAQIYDFIMSLDEEFDFEFKDNGSGLSGGQKQRLAIARALLSNANIVILDEATSQVDIESESKIYNLIKTLSEDLTIIVIAHRLNAIKNADNIIIFEEGRVAAQGNHNELLTYSNFYSDSLGVYKDK